MILLFGLTGFLTCRWETVTLLQFVEFLSALVTVSRLIVVAYKREFKDVMVKGI